MWLLETGIAQELRAKFRLMTAPTVQQLDQFAAHMQVLDARSDAPRNLKIAGDVAEISIKGVLTKKPDFFLWFFGIPNTTYEQIESSIGMASADPAVKRLVFSVDSPGGNVDGLFDALAAMDAITKPKSTRASLAASAGYAFAALGGKIEATNAAATFGSIGVVSSYVLDEDLVEITSTKAPAKRPDPSTEEGKAVIREYLDAIHQLFADAIARGRGTDADVVNEKYGAGRVFVAGDAKKRGMIDKIAKPALRAVPVEVDEGAPAEAKSPEPISGSGSNPVATATPTSRTSKMTKEELKAQHPELHAALLKDGNDAGKKEGAEAAIKTERDRVEAFLVAGENSGDMKGAIEGIRAGSEMTMASMAKFMFASRNKSDIETRQAETDAAGKVLEGTPAAAAASTPQHVFVGKKK